MSTVCVCVRCVIGTVSMAVWCVCVHVCRCSIEMLVLAVCINTYRHTSIIVYMCACECCHCSVYSVQVYVTGGTSSGSSLRICISSIAVALFPGSPSAGNNSTYDL